MLRLPWQDREKPKHQNDALTIFFWSVAVYVLAFTVVATGAALGNTPSEATVYVLGVLLLGFLWFLNIVDINSYLNLIEKDPESENRVALRGVLLGSFVLLLTFTLSVFVALKVPLPGTSLRFTRHPDMLHVIAEIALASMASLAFLKFRIASSLLSSLVHKSSEHRHSLRSYSAVNTIFRYLAYISTAYVMALLTIEATSDTHVSPFIILLHLSIVLVYGLHNRVLAKLCISNPMLQSVCQEARRRKHGQYVALSVTVFCATIAVLEPFGIVQHTPLLLLLFALGTGAILVVTVVQPGLFTDRLANWVLKKKLPTDRSKQ